MTYSELFTALCALLPDDVAFKIQVETRRADRVYTNWWLEIDHDEYDDTLLSGDSADELLANATAVVARYVARGMRGVTPIDRIDAERVKVTP